MTIFKGNITGDVTIRKGDDATKLTSVGGYPIATAEQGLARLKAIAIEVIGDPTKLDMDIWHNKSGGCGTSHCIAGWAVHLEPGGYDLERKVGSTQIAGNILLGVEASKLFFLKNDAARAALHRVLDNQPLFPGKEGSAGSAAAGAEAAWDAWDARSARDAR